jgi:hypothetical protein
MINKQDKDHKIYKMKPKKSQNIEKGLDKRPQISNGMIHSSLKFLTKVSTQPTK